MKAKKLIAIGLVAAMTLGMSTSVFAEGSVYPDYTGEPAFGEDYGAWDETYGPYDDAYHVRGQGWLEGGSGINESVVNVLVPTTPSVNLKRGEPGLFDFGIDPQRLVKRTDAEKYKDKEYFTKNAAEAGIYFINNTRDYSSEQIYKPSGEINPSLNTFDNKSVKYSAMNIGTEPVAFSVQATLTGGKKFTYLTEKPGPQTADEFFTGLWEIVGSKWTTYVTTNPKEGSTDPIWSVDDADMYHFAYDLVEGSDYYYIDEVFEEGSQERTAFTQAIGSNFVLIGGTEPYTGRELLDYVLGQQSCTDTVSLLALLSNYQLVLDESEPVAPTEGTGMYMALNVATGVEAMGDQPLPPYTSEKEIPFEQVLTSQSETPVVENNAMAGFTQVVSGNEDNYVLVWDEGTHTYKDMMRKDREKPFNTVDFWFSGIATNNEEGLIPEGFKPPTLDFTWSFSKENLPKVAPFLKTVNGVAYEGEFDTADEGVYRIQTSPALIEDGVALGFGGDFDAITGLQVSTNGGESWWSYGEADVPTFYEINGDKLNITKKVFDQVERGSSRYWKLSFDNQPSIVLQIVKGSN